MRNAAQHANRYSQKRLKAFAFCPVLFFIFLLMALPATAQENKSPKRQSIPPYLSIDTLYPDTSPSAYLPPKGFVLGEVAVSDPYVHGVFGYQVLDDLYLGFRQTAEISDLNEGANRLYPGFDLKYRFMKEGPYRPEATLGLISATGHRRTASEYLSFSKRFYDFSVTGGMAWGRLGSAGHIRNPLGLFIGHFDQKRTLTGEDPNAPENWFSGRRAGIFGNLAYISPDKEWGFKLGWGADRYVSETESFGFDSPAPWSAEFTKNLLPWLDFSLGTLGGDKVIGRVNMKYRPAAMENDDDQWIAAEPVRPGRAERTDFLERNHTAFKHNLDLGMMSGNTLLGEESAGSVHLNNTAPFYRQTGLALRIIANTAGGNHGMISVTPVYGGLNGRRLEIDRRTLEKAHLKGGESIQEVWKATEFAPEDKYAGLPPGRGLMRTRFILDQDASIFEDDIGVLYRTGFISSLAFMPFKHLSFNTDLRLNIIDNIQEVTSLRKTRIDPVRSDLADFADKPGGIDRFYAAYRRTLATDLYLGLDGGFLEEMFGGYGGQILYRPFHKRYAVGANLHHVFKREPDNFLGLAFQDRDTVTGHLDFFYELPETSSTIQLRGGRYLAGDWGSTLALNTILNADVKLRTYVTVTNKAEEDSFGARANIVGGFTIAIPFYSLNLKPENFGVRLDLEPLARDSGQSLDIAFPLYEKTQPLSKRYLYTSFRDIVR